MKRYSGFSKPGVVALELLIGGQQRGLHVLTFKQAEEDIGDLGVPRKLHRGARAVMFAVGAEGPEPRCLDQDHSNVAEASGVGKMDRKSCRRIGVELTGLHITYSPPFLQPQSIWLPSEGMSQSLAVHPQYSKLTGMK